MVGLSARGGGPGVTLPGGCRFVICLWLGGVVGGVVIAPVGCTGVSVGGRGGAGLRVDGMLFVGWVFVGRCPLGVWGGRGVLWVWGRWLWDGGGCERGGIGWAGRGRSRWLSFG